MPAWSRHTAFVCLALSVAACKPGPSGKAGKAAPPPTEAAAPSRTSGALYDIDAKAPAKGVWTYAVAVKDREGEKAGFDALRFRTSTDLKPCKLALVQAAPASTFSLTRPGATGLRADFAPSAATPAGAKAWTAATFELRCDKGSGTLSLVFSDIGGKLRERVVLGPVVGPRD